MYETKLAAVYILFATSVCVRCEYWQKIWPLDNDEGGVGDEYHGLDPRYNHRVPAWNCDTENTNTMDEIKAEIQNLQQLVVGLRQKMDPDFKLPPPRMEVMPLASVHSQQLLVHPSGISASSAESKCPPGFQYVDRTRSCYKFVQEEHNWTAAGQRCHDFHPEAHLAVITSNDENLGLAAYLRPITAKNALRVGFHSWLQYTLLWTSGQRLNETSCTDEFVWKMANSTQLPLSFTYWEREEPNCHLNQVEGCLQLKTFVGFKWNDAPCGSLAFPLCEYDPL